MTDPLILIADDHALFRKGVVKALTDLNCHYKFLEAENGKVCLELCSSYPVAVVLLDIAMPVLDGHGVIEGLKSHRSPPKIIALTLYDEPSLILHLLRKGVHGYVAKNAEPAHLMHAIAKVLKGQIIYPLEIADSIQNLIHKNKSALVNLSKREIEIIQLMAKGFTSKEIALKTGYTERTVETKKARLEKKMNVKNASQLIDLAHRFGILGVGSIGLQIVIA